MGKKVGKPEAYPAIYLPEYGFILFCYRKLLRISSGFKCSPLHKGYNHRFCPRTSMCFIFTYISLEVHKNFKNLINKKNSTIFAIIGGNVIDKQRKRVLSYGDIIRTGTLKKMSEVFKINKYLTVIRVWE